MQPYYRRDFCGICGEADFKLIIDIPATPPADEYIPAALVHAQQKEYPLSLFLCNHCKLLQLLDIVNPKILYDDYIYETSISLGLAAHFQNFTDEVIGFVKPEKGSNVVDIGCNDGTLLKFFQEKGMNVLGVEPAREIARKAQASGLRVYPEYCSVDLARKIRHELGPAAIVTANNVFANIPDLHEFVKAVRHLLAGDGVYVFETGYALDVLEKNMIETIAHEHIYYFRVKPLQYLFGLHGMELIDVKHIGTKGGSLRCVVQVTGGPRRVSPSVSALIDKEEQMGFDDIDAYRKIVDRIEAGRKELKALLHDIAVQGKTVSGFGASAGVTTLLYYYDIGKAIDCLYDDNQARHHLVSPGFHIPVLPPERIYEKNPDYILILAWRYADPIVEKHQAYLTQGGKFIVPLPKIEVIERA